MQATLTLAEFLLARIGETEAKEHQRKRLDAAQPTPFGDRDLTWTSGRIYDGERDVTDSYGQWLNSLDSAADPRVLAECAAKRRIVDYIAGHPVPSGSSYEAGAFTDAIVLRYLAAPYADHPDYRDEWRA